MNLRTALRGKPRPVLGALAELTNAANAVRPLGRKGYSTLPTFAFGWPTSENAPLLFAGSLLDVGRRWLLGHYRTRNGRISLVLKAVTWGLLALLQRRETESKHYFEDPLKAALGADYLEAKEPERRPRGVFGTGWTRRRYVHETARYGPHGPNMADIWMRPDLPRDGKAPVLLQIPGGAWMIGMRRPQAYPMLSRMAEHGWICVSIGYRISPKYTWPDHIVDVKQSIAWVKENIASYGGDPEAIYITGGSAGGHLTALAALTPNDPKWQPGFEDADTSVAAAVPIYGRYDWFTDTGDGRPQFIKVLEKFIVKLPFDTNRQVYLDASPLTLVHADAPPFFILHGEDDSVIPVHEGREFAKALQDVSKAPVIYAEIPHAQHAFDFFGSAHGHNTAAAVERFLNWVRG